MGRGGGVIRGRGAWASSRVVDVAKKNRLCVDASCDRHLELHAARDVPGNNVPSAGMKPAFASLKAARI